MDPTSLKKLAAEKAIEFVEDGMRLGLGTGSTAAEFVALLGDKVAGGLRIIAVPTSEATRQQAEGLNIPLTTLDETPELDLTVDGADELDRELRLIKGGGGALLREKIVAMASDRMIVIADNSKFVETLGKFPLPVEVVPFGLSATKAMMAQVSESAGCTGELKLRELEDGTPFLTDGGHLIIDCHFNALAEPEILEDMFAMIPGVVETGLFLGIADAAIIAGSDGVQLIEAVSEPDQA